MGENRTERANIPFTSEMNFCLRCHILPQEDEMSRICNARINIYCNLTYWTIIGFPHPTLSPHVCPPLIGTHTTVNHLPTFSYSHVIGDPSLSDCRYVLPSTSGGQSRRRGASTPGSEQCPTQTGRGLWARGDQRGRGTRAEYDRRGKTTEL